MLRIGRSRWGRGRSSRPLFLVLYGIEVRREVTGEQGAIRTVLVNSLQEVLVESCCIEERESDIEENHTCYRKKLLDSAGSSLGYCGMCTGAPRA